MHNSSNPAKQTPHRNTWIPSFFRTSPATSLETILNPSGSNSAPLDARPVIPLISSNHPLSQRIRLLRELAVLFEHYTFTRVDDVWAAVEDFLATTTHEARREAFRFMTACIKGQYEDLGMARVVFYNAVRNHRIWEDFPDMFTVIFELTNEGRDISSFEKNIVKLLISWLDTALRRAEALRSSSSSSLPSSISDAPIPNLQPILHLITLVVKFNFGNLEERESTTFVHAVYRAFHVTRNPDDARSCITFLDVLVRYGFCPPEALVPFTDILCRTINWDAVSLPTDDRPPPAAGSALPWTVFQNVLLSHYAHNVIRIMCNRLREPLGSDLHTEEVAVRGAMTLLGRAVWEEQGADQRRGLSMVLTNMVLLISMRAAVARRNAAIDEEVLKWMNVVIKATRDGEINPIAALEWEVLLDMAEDLAWYMMETDKRKERIGAAALVMTDGVGVIFDEEEDDLEDKIVMLDTRLYDGTSNTATVKTQNEQYLRIIDAFSKFVLHLQYMYTSSSFPGPIARYMALLHTLRRHLPETTTLVLLNYYDHEHLFYPSSEDWLRTLSEVVDTFYRRRLRSPRKIRLRVLQIVTDVYMVTKDFYSAEVLDSVLIPMVKGLVREADHDVTQQATDLLVQVLQDCTEKHFEVLLKVLSGCATCRCVESKKVVIVPGSLSTSSSTGTNNLQSNRYSLPSTPSTATNFASVGPVSASVTPVASTAASITTASVPPSPSTSIAMTLVPPHPCHALPAAMALTSLFEHLLYRPNSSTACIATFREMITVAQRHSFHAAPRLAIFGCLSSLRCRPDHRIYISLDQEQLPAVPGVSIPAGIGSHPISRSGSVSSTMNDHDTHRAAEAQKVAISQTLQRKPSDKNLILTTSIGRGAGGGGGVGPIPRKGSMRDILSEAKLKPVSSPGDSGGSGTRTDQPHAEERKFVMPVLTRRSPYMISPTEKRDPHASPRIGEETVGITKVQTEEPGGRKMVELPLGEYLAIIVNLLAIERDWDVFSYVLYRLPVQLACKHLFCGTAQELRQLRAMLHDHITANKFADAVNNVPPNTKRPDTYILAYQILTVLISYRRIFLTRVEQDEIVHDFYWGLQKTTNSSKLCINALTVCCHEIPQSVSRYLPSMLIKLGQMISSPAIPVHILELLSGLARLPNLYQSFTDADFKRVFGIALLYIEYSYAVTSNQQAAAASATSGSPIFTVPNSTNNSNSLGTINSALSQYVLIMAFHVIEIWFIAVPLRDRSRHVSFIVHSLLGANKSTYSIDEQTLTCIDMLARYTYAECELRPERNPVADALLGGKNKDKVRSKTWVNGMSLVTLRTAKHTGWADITIRRPSGVVSMMIKVENQLRIETVDYASLPAMLMMHYKGDGRAAEEFTESPLPSAGVSIGMGIELASAEEEIGTADGAISGHPLGITMVSEGTDGVEEEVASSKGEQERPSSAPPSRRLSANDDDQHRQLEPRRSGSTTALPMMSPLLAMDSPIMPARTRRMSFSRQSGWLGFGLGPTPSEEALNIADLGTGVSDSWIPTSPYLGLKFKQSMRARVENGAEDDARSSDLDVSGGSYAGRMDPLIKDIFTEPVTSGETVATRKGDLSTDPSFLFLQFSNYPDLTNLNPLSAPLPDNEVTARGIAVLDRIAVVDFHKIGILYVGKDQTNETDILRNQHGSPDYINFLNSLGTIARLRGNKEIYTGGLDTENNMDGEYAYYWSDAITQMIFHVATMMPNNERDPQANLKKRHIGNDWVTIIYNDSGRDYAFETVPSEFNFIQIVISPHSEDSTKVISSQNLHSPSMPLPITRDYTFFKVVMQRRSDMPEIGPATEFKMVSFQTLPHFVRQMAMHANVFAQVFLESTSRRQEYLSNWRARLRNIKQIRDRAMGVTDRLAPGLVGPLSGAHEVPAARTSKDGIMVLEPVLDFTRYT